MSCETRCDCSLMELTCVLARVNESARWSRVWHLRLTHIDDAVKMCGSIYLLFSSLVVFPNLWNVLNIVCPFKRGISSQSGSQVHINEIFLHFDQTYPRNELETWDKILNRLTKLNSSQQLTKNMWFTSRKYIREDQLKWELWLLEFCTAKKFVKIN